MWRSSRLCRRLVLLLATHVKSNVKRLVCTKHVAANSSPNVKLYRVRFCLESRLFWRLFVFLGRTDYYCAPVEEDLMIKVGIVGGTGYTGVELLRLLVQHSGVEIVAITSDRQSTSLNSSHATISY